MLLCSFALAETPSLLFPGAAPTDAGTGEARVVLVGGGYGVADTVFAVGGGQLRAEHAVTDRLLVGASATALYGQAGADPGTFLLGTVAARYAVVRSERINVAPYVAWAAPVIPDERVVRQQGFVGVACEGGGERTRWDFTVPVPLPLGDPASRMIGVVEPASYALAALGLSEAGVTLSLGEADTLRLGKGAGVGPSVRYRHLTGPWVVDLEVTAPQLLGVSTQLGVGRRW